MKLNPRNLLIGSLALIPLLASMGNQPSHAYEPNDLQRLKTTGSCQQCDLSGANLTNIRLTNANLKGANLTNTNLTNARIIDSDLRSVDFSGATIKKTNVYGTQIAISALSQTQYDGLIFKKPEPMIVEKEAARPQKTSRASTKSPMVSITNHGGYRAKYLIQYFVDKTFPGGVKVPLLQTKTGDVRAIYQERVAESLPKGARDIRLMVKTRAGKSFFINTSVANNRETCFKLKGTVFNPSYEKNSCLGF